MKSGRLGRLAVALVVLMGAVGLGGLSTAPPVTSAPPFQLPKNVLRANGTNGALFVGALWDGADRPVDDLVIEAFRDGSTTPTATALTYASRRYRRDHGQFDLHVRPGSFRILVTGSDSLGRELFQPRWVGGPQKIWAINKSQKIRLGGIHLVPIGTFPTRTYLDFEGSNNVRVGQKIFFDLAVRCSDVRPVKGAVTYYVNDEPLAKRFLTGQGSDSVWIRPTKRGVYTIRAEYGGGSHTEASTSQTLRFSASGK